MWTGIAFLAGSAPVRGEKADRGTVLGSVLPEAPAPPHGSISTTGQS